AGIVGCGHPRDPEEEALQVKTLKTDGICHHRHLWPVSRMQKGTGHDAGSFSVFGTDWVLLRQN
ncbi:hypothetical protein, partial [Faecalibaculum rodentium]|uniref:hypothetical protein n=1 Tax=Faecalibaculum rodentium TaxID=1702221 RepID=UPI002620B359